MLTLIFQAFIQVAIIMFLLRGVWITFRTFTNARLRHVYSFLCILFLCVFSNMDSSIVGWMFVSFQGHWLCSRFTTFASVLFAAIPISTPDCLFPTFSPLGVLPPFNMAGTHGLSGAGSFPFLRWCPHGSSLEFKTPLWMEIVPGTVCTTSTTTSTLPHFSGFPPFKA